MQQNFSAESEYAVLGFLLNNPQNFDTMSMLLQPDDFFGPHHQQIFKALQRVNEMSSKYWNLHNILDEWFEGKESYYTFTREIGEQCLKDLMEMGKRVNKENVIYFWRIIIRMSNIRYQEARNETVN